MDFTIYAQLPYVFSKSAPLFTHVCPDVKKSRSEKSVAIRKHEKTQ